MKIDPIQNGTKVQSSIIASLAVAENEKLPPAGYMPIELSTKGKLHAPKLFHIRNFKTNEIMALSLTEDRDLPLRLVDLLNDMIYEEGVDVSKFHEREVVETMVKLYASFYSPIFRDVVFPIQEDDLQHLRDNLPKVEAEKQIKDLLEGRWKPLVDIDIINNVHTYDEVEKLKPSVTITDKKTGFSVAFRLPLYGDLAVVKRWLNEAFADEEKSFVAIKQKLEVRERMLDRLREGVDIDMSKIPYVSDDEENNYREFALKQASVAVEVIRALHLSMFDGEDVSEKSIVDRVALVQDPRLDARVTKKLDKYFSDLHFGIKEDVDMINPLTGKPCTRRFSFRPAFIIQATKLPEVDDYEFVFDE